MEEKRKENLNKNPPNKPKKTFNDYNILKEISREKFSTIYLVEEKSSKRKYAMKKINLK